MTAELVFIVLAALAAAVCVAVLAERLPKGERIFEASLTLTRDTDRRPAQLIRAEQVVGWSSASGLDAHTRLRPVLTEIADARLARRGLRLDRDPDKARRLLGPKAWELVRPDRSAPPDHQTPGIGSRELDQVLDALEAV